MTRSTLAASAFVTLGLFSATARADRLQAARGQALAEVSHTVNVTIDRGVARYVVRRTFSNPGPQAEEAVLRIDLAHGAAATGLRIRARDRWYAGDLLPAEEARAKYRELTGIGDWEAKDPALLEWAWADQVRLRLFPVLPEAVSTVEYTLTVPLDYREGRYVLSYPRPVIDDDTATLALAKPVLTVSPGYGDATTRVVVAGQRVAPGAAVVLEPAEPPPWVGDGTPAPGVGYAFDSVAFERAIEVTGATVDLEIDHTYSGDLEVELVRPDGIRHDVTVGNGGENDLRGRFEVDLGDPVSASGSWTLVVSDHAGLDVGTLDAWSLALHPNGEAGAPLEKTATGLPAFIPDASDGEGAGGQAIIEIEAPPMRRIDVRLGRVAASGEHGFSRLELDVARRLSALPEDASVVFVVDVSRSVEDVDIEEQLRIAQSYLAHVPDATAQVIVFDREARALFDDFVPATDFDAAVDRARAQGRLVRGNGSALEDGLEVAARALAPRSGPRRVVAMTDGRLRTRFTNAMGHASLARLPRSGVAHLVVPRSDIEPSVSRADAHDLGPIAARTGGVLFRVAMPEDSKLDDRIRAALPLVRPISLDHVRVGGLDLSGVRDMPDSLGEGEGYRAMLSTSAPTARVVIRGKLWAQTVRKAVTNTRHFDQATAAFVFSEDEHGDLSEAEMLKVAYRGRAVSPVTSYLAIEPGVRPSTIGFEDALFLGGAGLVGRGGGGGGAFRSIMKPPSLESLLKPAARRCAARLSTPPGWTTSLDVETTSIEIVDVKNVASSDAALGRCVEDETWATLLPAASWPERKTHHVDLRSD